jgi:hypothetical protein
VELPTFLGMNSSVAIVLVQRPRGDVDLNKRMVCFGSLTGAEGQNFERFDAECLLQVPKGRFRDDDREITYLTTEG